MIRLRSRRTGQDLRDDPLVKELLAAAKRPPVCEGCGVNRADPPSALCPGCQAYREHQQ